VLIASQQTAAQTREHGQAELALNAKRDIHWDFPRIRERETRPVCETASQTKSAVTDSRIISHGAFFRFSNQPNQI
jgi:hypothetical protein